jgi:hypothetical protein
MTESLIPSIDHGVRWYLPIHSIPLAALSLLYMHFKYFYHLPSSRYIEKATLGSASPASHHHHVDCINIIPVRRFGCPLLGIFHV